MTTWLLLTLTKVIGKRCADEDVNGFDDADADKDDADADKDDADADKDDGGGGGADGARCQGRSLEC